MLAEKGRKPMKLGTVALLGAVLLSAFGVAIAQSDIVAGEDTYRAKCQNCHAPSFFANQNAAEIEVRIRSTGAHVTDLTALTDEEIANMVAFLTGK